MPPRHLTGLSRARSFTRKKHVLSKRALKLGRATWVAVCRLALVKRFLGSVNRSRWRCKIWLPDAEIDYRVSLALERLGLCKQLVRTLRLELLHDIREC